jgi:hypothetical protein
MLQQHFGLPEPPWKKDTGTAAEPASIKVTA